MLSAAILAGALVFNNGLTLLPPEVPPPHQPDSVIDQRRDPTPPPVERRPAWPVPAATVATALAALGVRMETNRKGRSSPGGGTGRGSPLSLKAPPDMRVVFVPGHGSPHASEAFETLVGLIGIDADSVRWFDYRWITGDADHAHASRVAPTTMAAWSLNSFLAGVAAEGKPMYVVGFSKGGATVAQLVAAWDRGFPGPSDAVVGTALLDPPIASGVSGWLQSVGKSWSAVPNDGGYDPVSCVVARFMCTDARIDLGSPSGVEVIVIQNPKAAVTNLAGTAPPGLRVVDIPDHGPTIFEQATRNALRVPSRIAQAHQSVLTDPRVAACVRAEMWSPGSCGMAPASAKSAATTVARQPMWQRME